MRFRARTWANLPDGDSAVVPWLRSRGRNQYDPRPPERSNAAPVENEHWSDASHATSVATSSGRPIRRMGILLIAASRVAFDSVFVMEVSISTGVMQFPKRCCRESAPSSPCQDLLDCQTNGQQAAVAEMLAHHA